MDEYYKTTLVTTLVGAFGMIGSRDRGTAAPVAPAAAMRTVIARLREELQAGKAA
jgi:hypothetical protein